MSRRPYATLAVLAGLALSAVGCAGIDYEAQVADLLREREDLQRRNTQLEGKLAAEEAQRTALEREMKARKPPEIEVPQELRDRGVAARKRGGATVLELPSDLFFPSGSATLSKGGEKALARMMDVIRKNDTGSMIRVEGHADNDPIRRTKSKYHCNWELSFERAHAVGHYLIEKGGVDPKRIAFDGYGEYQPQDPKNKAKNRRVEIVLCR